MKSEVWKNVPIPEFSEYYRISSYGRVESNKCGSIHLMQPHRGRHGFLSVNLYGDRGIRRKIAVHRLVALAFVENPDGFKFIKFKDGDIDNLNAENLEWVACGSRDCKRNGDSLKWQYHGGLAAPKAVKGTKNSAKTAVYKNGKLIAIYKSRAEASKETGIYIGYIIGCVKGYVDSCKGLVFRDL